jgi:hypothetical protein
MEPEGSLPHLQVPATCPYPELDRPSPCPHVTAWRSILILSSNLRLGIISGLFPSSFFQQNTVYTSTPIRAISTAHLILLDLITRTILGEEYRSLSSSLCSFLHSPNWIQQESKNRLSWTLTKCRFFCGKELTVALTASYSEHYLAS